jgi:hypothetical protein
VIPHCLYEYFDRRDGSEDRVPDRLPRHGLGNATQQLLCAGGKFPALALDSREHLVRLPKLARCDDLMRGFLRGIQHALRQGSFLLLSCRRSRRFLHHGHLTVPLCADPNWNPRAKSIWGL